MKKAKLITALVTLLCLLSTMLVGTAFAAEDSGQRWNIMLVVDGSGSLAGAEGTDPQGLRYEAISSLLDVLQSDGNNVGAIVFSGTTGRDTSDEAMMESIMLDTGLLKLDGVAPNGDIGVNYLKKILKDVGIDLRTDGGTDIGTALLTAERELEALNNGLPNIIFLFTDGQTEMKSHNTQKKSIENMQTAVDLIKENGTKLCGVFLNKDGLSDSQEVKGIVSMANGISTNGLEFSDMYVEITDAASCFASTDKFLAMLGFNVSSEGEDDLIIYNSETLQFRIPGIGVEAASFRFRSDSGDTLPAGMEIGITDPNGRELSEAAMDSICSKSRTYRLYKIVNPDSGIWTISVTMPEGNKVGVRYAPIVSLFVDAVLNCDKPVDSLHAGDTVTFTVGLTQDGQPVTNPNAYNEYEATLFVTKPGGEAQEYALTLGENSMYELPLELGYGSYDAQAFFRCEKIIIATNHITIDTANEAPKAEQETTKELTKGIFSGSSRSFELTELAFDREDGHNLSCAIVGNTADGALSLEGTTLHVDSSAFDNMDTLVTFTDSQGASTQMTLHLTVKSLIVRDIIIIAIALIIALIIAIIIAQGKVKLYGTTTLSFFYDGDVKKKIKLTLPNLGSDCKRSISLYDAVRISIEDNEELKFAHISCGHTQEDVKKYLLEKKDISNQLKKCKLGTAKMKVPEDDYTITVGVLTVKNGSKKEKLFNSEYSIGDKGEFTLAYKED